MLKVYTSLIDSNKNDKKIIEKRMIKSKWRLLLKGYADEFNEKIVVDKDGQISSNFIEKEYFKLENNLAEFYIAYNKLYMEENKKRFIYKTLLDDLSINLDLVETNNLTTQERRRNKARLTDSKNGFKKYYEVKRELLAIDAYINVIVQNFHFNIMTAKYQFEENITDYLQGAYLARYDKKYKKEYELNMKKVFEEIRKSYAAKYLEEETYV